MLERLFLLQYIILSISLFTILKSPERVIYLYSWNFKLCGKLIAMKTKIVSVILLLIGTYAFSQNSYELFGNFISESTPYEAKIKTTKTQEKITSFKIQICKTSTECEESIEIVNNFDQETFISAMRSTMKKSKMAGATFVLKPEVELQWKNIYYNLMKDFNKKEVLTELYDLQDIEYGGRLKMNKELIKLKSEDSIVQYLYFAPKYASVRLFNNKINSISVVGNILDSSGTIIKEEATLFNSKYSIPFRSTIVDRNNYSAKIYTTRGTDHYYYIECNDLLDYKPFENNYSYSLKNKEYEIKVDEELKVEKRGLYDYFTAIIFSDFLGFNNEGGNSILQAEGRARIPLNYVNFGRFNSPEYMEAYLNASIYNGQEEGSGFIEFNVKDNLKNISSFELLRKNNVEAGLNIGVGSFEWKGTSTNWILDYGIQMYRTKFRTIKDTITTNYQLYSISHGPRLKIEIRPQINFGADVNFGLLGLKYSGANKDLDIIEGRNFRKEILKDNGTFYNTLFLTTNFYTKLSPNDGNGGLYFRLGGYYDFYTKNIAPQVMVGYATNLTTFINKFKKNDAAAK